MPQQQLSPGGRLAIGFALLVGGLGIAAVAIDLLTLEPDKLASSNLVGAAGGLAFALAGALLVLPARFVRLRALLAAMLVTSFAWALDWIAFGPGERQFSGGASSAGIGIGFHPSELVGRIAFGIGAVLLDIMALVTWVWCLRLLRGATNKPDNESP